MTFHFQTDKKPPVPHNSYKDDPLRQNASTRTKEYISTIRHVYLDLDQGGTEASHPLRTLGPCQDRITSPRIHPEN